MKQTRTARREEPRLRMLKTRFSYRNPKFRRFFHIRNCTQRVAPFRIKIRNFVPLATLLWHRL